MFKVAIVLLGVAAAALAQSDCKKAFIDGSKCFIDASDAVVAKHNLDLKSMSDCVRRTSKSCSSVVTSQFGSSINDLDPETSKKCAKESMDGSKDDMKECMNKQGYEGHGDGGLKERDGPKFIGLVSVIKLGEKTCLGLSSCLPSNFNDVKKDLCDEKAKCFPAATKQKCPTMEDDVEAATCKCFKDLPNKQKMVDDFKACIGTQDATLFAKLSGKLTSNVLLNEVQKNVCKSDYSQKFDICDSSNANFGKNAGRPSLFNRLGGGGGAFSFLNRGG